MQYLPKAVLGAVIVFAAIGLFEPTAWRALAAVDHVEVSIAAVTTGCVIVLGVLEALIVAVGLSMIAARCCPSLVVHSPIFWAAPELSQRLRCDVLVQVEEVVGIVGPLDLDEAVVVLAVVVSNSVVVVVLHEVDVAARL